MPWKTAYTDKKGSKSSKERTMVLLLGGSIYDDSARVRIVERRRRGDEDCRTSQDVRLQELLCERDFRALTNFFERTGAVIWRCIPSKIHCSRFEALDHINTFFQLNGTSGQKGEKRTFIIYWCGHGEQDTGDWAFSHGGFITCRDIIDAWQSRPIVSEYGDMSALTVIADTCHSGAWIEEFQAENIPRLVYQAACRADEVAFSIHDGIIPRSLLMRKFLIEQQHSIDRYTWTCTQQHPIHLCTYTETEDAEDVNDGQRRVVMHGSPFLFFTIDHHWTPDEKLSNEERKELINRLTQYGTFIDDDC